MSKKAIELSLNFIVIIIISIIIFGFGVRFIYRLSSQATDLQDITISELDERIGNLVCEGSDRVCFGIERKAIKRTNFDVFGLKIINILDAQDFDVRISPPIDLSDLSSPPKLLDSAVLGFKKDKTEIRFPQNPMLMVNPPSRSVFMGKNEEKILGIGVQVPANAAPGTYILNVEIKTSMNGKYGPYSATQKIYVDVQ